jgi:DnaJ-domain-containing protein 1
VLLPTDLIADVVLGLGWLDDLAVLYLVWRLFWAARAPSGPDRANTRSASDRPPPAAEDGTPLRPHDVLGVPPDASTDEIKSAYRQLVNQYHPDKVAHLGEEFQQLAEKRFKEIQLAFDALMQSRNEEK